MKYFYVRVFILSAILLFSSSFSLASESSGELPGSKDRCPVCGMFIAKYPMWIALVEMENGNKFWFDGVKDLMAYYFSPTDYGGSGEATIKKITVRDYYSQLFIDGEKAWYVIGSDVYGPMGHELIPFSSEKAAQSFYKDHHAKEIMTFKEIRTEKIESMRTGHKMNIKHGKK